MNVFIFRDFDLEIMRALRQEFPKVEFRQSMNPQDLAESLNWAEALFGNPPAERIGASPALRWLQIVSSGFDEYSRLRGHRIIVTTAHGVHAPIIAQHALAMILWFARGQPQLAQRQGEHVWDRRPSIPRDLAEQTVGLVGYGEVGRALARILRPIGPTLVAAKRSPAEVPPELDAIYGFDQLEVLLGMSDHVVITLPLTPQTRGVFGAARLAQCKRGAVLHNISRGELVDEDALQARLSDGALGGAALDVFAEEPLPPTSPFWDMPNVVVTPHLAGHHRDLGRATLERFKSNLRRYLAGQSLEHVADFERGY